MSRRGLVFAAYETIEQFYTRSGKSLRNLKKILNASEASNYCSQKGLGVGTFAVGIKTLHGIERVPR